LIGVFAVSDDSLQYGPQLTAVVGVEISTRVAYHLADGACIAAGNWTTAGHRLERGYPESLVSRGIDESGRRLVVRVQDLIITPDLADSCLESKAPDRTVLVIRKCTATEGHEVEAPIDLP
jgi:hypothetical protein